MFFCIDFGSTFIKYFVYDGQAVMYSGRTNFPTACIDDGVRYEVSLHNINKSIFQIFENTKAFEIKKAFIAVQMHGYILRNSSGIFSNYVSWKDMSGDLSNSEVQSIDFSKNGTSLKKNLPAVKLLTKKPEGNVELFTLGSYIAYLLTGKNITHKTDGCASGFFDAETLKPMELKNISLPKVSKTVIPAGRYRDIVIYTPTGDHQISFWGSRANEDAYLLNIGTATQLSTLSNDQNECSDFEKRPYFNQKRLLTVSGLTGGEKLFAGYPVEDFLHEILCAAKKLPYKNKMYVGGGGAEIVFE